MWAWSQSSLGRGTTKKCWGAHTAPAGAFDHRCGCYFKWGEIHNFYSRFRHCMGDLNISLLTIKQRVHLSLKKKVEIIETSRKNRTLTLKALGDHFLVAARRRLARY